MLKLLLFFFLEPRWDQILVADTGPVFDISFDGIRTADDNQTRPRSWDPCSHRRF